ncbi:lipid II flippase MurJ [Streptomyces sp. NPDC091272]|uniref:lipid II flippase MurJ n=1 Tax=Streptomyces sp. NPDC091272 TaxID=3365981 RepID=UPI0038243EF2
MSDTRAGTNPPDEVRPGAAAPVLPAKAEPPRLGRLLVRAAWATAVLTAAGSLLGLVRDQTIAHLFGAGVESDAFLIAWTVPEMASTLLIEDAMALLLIPAFSHALTRRAAGAADDDGPGQDPVRALVTATFPRLFGLLACVAALLMVGAPWVVRILAPGFEDPRLAVDCTRLTAITVLTFALTGYCSAGLRAHGRFLAPAGVYVAYNVGIIATMLALHAVWGVRAAAAGVALGSLLMILVQLPGFARLVFPVRPRRSTPRPSGTVRPRRSTLRSSGVVRPRRSIPRPSGTARPRRSTPRPSATARLRRSIPRPAGRPRAATVRHLGIALLMPVILFTLSRQSQVLVERFYASGLPAGAISHLNYAQKVAQMPMVLSLMICTVTFPAVAQAMARGDLERARRRVERDLGMAGTIVLLGTAVVLGYAPQMIEVLFQRGAFGAQDTVATATAMRVYSLGLLGHCLVGALGRPFFSAGRPTWYPAAAMGAGLVVTTAAGALTVSPWGVYGIAAANAVGISTTALLLLAGIGSRVLPIDVRAVSVALGRLTVAAAAAAAAGWLVGPLVADPLLSLAAGCLLAPVTFVLTGLAVKAPEVVHLLALTRQRFCHDR